MVDLPQPDSPTRPKVSPAATSKDTPSTARTTLLPAPKLTRKSRTVITASLREPGRVTREHGEAAATRADARQRGQQALGIRMPRAAELGRRALLDNAA